jgi:energy-coupling factor transport system substrate-specific component
LATLSDSVGANLARYGLFFLTTSLVWDLGRSLMSLLVVVLAGPALLRALRRAGRRAAFGVPVVFER